MRRDEFAVAATVFAAQILFDLLAKSLSGVIAHWPPLAILLVMFSVAALLSQVMSDAATTALLGPVAISLAQVLDMPPTPFVVCTALGAVVAFLTSVPASTGSATSCASACR